jgi:hypothetical protein
MRAFEIQRFPVLVLMLQESCCRMEIRLQWVNTYHFRGKMSSHIHESLHIAQIRQRKLLRLSHVQNTVRLPW